MCTLAPATPTVTTSLLTILVAVTAQPAAVIVLMSCAPNCRAKVATQCCQPVPAVQFVVSNSSNPHMIHRYVYCY